MNLKTKKKLAARTLGVGAGRIMFNPGRTEEIKEALTKQDIRDLVTSGAIIIKEGKGRRTNEKRKRRHAGKIKKKVKTRKRDYINLTRKLREYSRQLKLQDKISGEKHKELRKQIRASLFRSKAHFKEVNKVENVKLKEKKK